MIRILPLAVACAVVQALLPASGAAAQTSIAAALPSGARVLSIVPVPGYPNSRAVGFEAGGHYIGLVALGRHARLVWRDKLPGPIRSMQAPGPGGAFAGLSGKGGSQQFFAFHYSGASVSSALAQHPTGLAAADEGASLHGSSLILVYRDRGHVGSVSYRLTSRYRWSGGSYRPTTAVRTPDYPAGKYPLPSGTIRASTGDVVLIRLEVADTPAKRETGLMNRISLDSDSGMVFVWDQNTMDAFWMENTYIPLTVAFLAADGTILQMEDMAPLTTTVHSAHQPYRFAIEVNQGYFARYHIRVGDRVEFRLH